MKFLIIPILMLFAYMSIGQTSPEVKNQIALRYTTSSKAVKLRWAPTTPELWKAAQNSGFMIERITYQENGKHYNPPLKKLINTNPILPAKESEWVQKMEENDQVAIIAQAFYGESFQLEAKNSAKKSVSVLDHATDINQRFAFSLMAADLSFEAAILAGWGFEDFDIVKDGYYQYRIYMNNSGQASSETIAINMQKKEKLPSPFGLYAEFDENLATVSWELSFTKQIYTAYNIERSYNNSDFQQLNRAPFFVTQSENKTKTRAEFTDSIPNNVPVYYRINGIDCFGQTGPYSNVVSGSAIEKLKALPEITDYEILDGDKAEFTWKFDRKEEDLILGFEVLRTRSLKKPFEPISNLLPPQGRKFKFTMQASNYIVVRALGLNGEETASNVYLIQRPDNTPPAKPAKPEGTIDSSGVVTLHWAPNTEDDLLGYVLYYSRLQGEEEARLNVDPITDTTYTDTITLNTFIEHINYQIKAVDRRNNYSEPSEMAILELPDTLKPVSPYFIKYRAKADSINLEWVNSASHDVAMHLLYRKTKADEKWRLHARFDGKSVTQFVDRELIENTRYSYLLLAVDDDELESEPSSPIDLKVPAFREPEPVKDFTGTFERDQLKIILRWKKNKNVEKYQLYKKEGDYPPFVYKTFDGPTNKFTDTKIKKFTSYQYMIRSKGKNGLYSPFQKLEMEW